MVGLAATSQAETAYVVDAGSGTVTPVDVSTGVAGPAISLGAGSGPRGIAIGPTGRMAYVTTTFADTVTPVDLGSGTAEPAIPVGSSPEGVAVSPDGSMVLVADGGAAQVTPIDTATGIAGPAIAVGVAPLGVAFAPDGRTAYVADEGSDEVTPIDVVTGSPGAPIPIGGGPSYIAITPDGRTAYVTTATSDTLTPIDLTTRTVGTPIPLLGAPEQVAIAPDALTAYVAFPATNQIEPIDLASATPGNPITVGPSPSGVAFSPDGTTAYATDLGVNTVTPIAVASGLAGAPITVGAQPHAVAFTPVQAPTAALAASAGPAGTPTRFDGSGSAAAGGAIASYRWSFGDGTTLSTATPSVAHTYAPGSYTASLTVTDTDGCSTTTVFTGQTAYCNGSPRATASRAITVPSPSPLPGATPVSGAPGEPSTPIVPSPAAPPRRPPGTNGRGAPPTPAPARPGGTGRRHTATRRSAPSAAAGPGPSSSPGPGATPVPTANALSSAPSPPASAGPAAGPTAPALPPPASNASPAAPASPSAPGQAAQPRSTPPALPANPRRSAFATLLRRPDQLSLSPADIARSLGIGLLLMALLGLPARVLNATWKAHRHELAAAFARAGRSLPALPPAISQHPVALIGASVLGAAAVRMFLNPGFPTGPAAAPLALGMLLGFGVVTANTLVTWRIYAPRWLPDRDGRWHTYGAQLGVGALCVATSRAAHLVPGLIFGQAGDWEPAQRPSLELRARRVALTQTSMATISLLAWAVSIPIGNLAARPPAGFGVLTLDAALAVIAVTGMELLVFSLIPLVFLDGHDLFTWRPRWWLALWGTGLIWFSLVVLNPAISHPEAHTRASVAWLASLLALEIAIAFGLWSFFAARRRRARPAVADRESPDNDTEPSDRLSVSIRSRS